MESTTTANLTEELIRREGVQVITIGISETIKIETGPIKYELTGPVKLIINYD